jgi:uncharacterized protein (DUF2147 family)
MASLRQGGRTLATLFAAILISLTAGLAPLSALEPTGLWLTELQAEILIRPCPEGWCGIVAKPVRPGLFDINNPDPALRSRPIEGLPMIWISESDRADELHAQLYNPIDGKMYEGVVTMRPDGRLHLRGCVFLIFCKAESWTKLAN